MTRTERVVVELGVEEIPSAYLAGLIADLRGRAVTALEAARLGATGLVVDGTPRRLVLMADVDPVQAPERRRVRGPALTAAYDADGRPTAALRGFLTRVGVTAEAVTPGEGADAKYVVALVESPVARAEEVLPGVLAAVLEGLEVPRSMRWTAGDVRFVRPVRWLLALLGDRVLAVQAFGVTAGRTTYGNRTDHPEALTVARADEYPEVLERARVMLARDRRRHAILTRGRELAEAAGGTLAVDAALLDEVTDLVEWPVPFLGAFDPAYLAVPAPILTTAMVHHQRYFPVHDAAGRLLPRFVGVRNGEGLDLAQVVAGNERVLRARLADAAFFYEEDRRTPLADLVPRLDEVVFHRRLGTYGDKTRRVVRLATGLAGALHLDAAEAAALERAAYLAKADLLTHVVGEFPELQGVIGGIYAAEQGEPPLVATAIRDQYRPGFQGDQLPETRVGQALSLLDRLDTLAGMEAHRLTPTGSEDPLGFRRMALGVARILVSGALGPVALADLVRVALSPFDADDAPHIARVLEFVAQRVRGWLGETYRGDLVDAVLAAPTPWDSLQERLEHLAGWSGQPEFLDVLTAFKRVINLAGETPVPAAATYPAGPERDLDEALREAEAHAVTWAAYWEAARSLKEPVDRFLDAVLVMDPDPAVRARRLGLLARVGAFLGRGADLTRVTGERRG
jgi:glycyl-tRNA synthetase beta chain